MSSFLRARVEGNVRCNTHGKKTIERVKAYAGVGDDFEYDNGDGLTDALERGARQRTHLRWDNDRKKRMQAVAKF